MSSCGCYRIERTWTPAVGWLFDCTRLSLHNPRAHKHLGRMVTLDAAARVCAHDAVQFDPPTETAR